MFGPIDYEIKKIEGEYATLVNIENSEELFIALALLPEGVDIGTELHYEMFEYTVKE